MLGVPFIVFPDTQGLRLGLLNVSPYGLKVPLAYGSPIADLTLLV